MPLRAVVVVEQSVIKALQRAIWTVLKMLLHAKYPSFGKLALWSTSRVLRSVPAVSGRRGELHKLTITLTSLEVWLQTVLTGSGLVSDERECSSCLFTYLFLLFFGGKAVTFFFCLHDLAWKWGMVLMRVLLTPLNDRLPLFSRAVKVTLIAVEKRFYLYL